MVAKIRNFMFLALLLILSLESKATARALFNNDWRFCRVTDLKNYNFNPSSASAHSIAEWESVSLPHTANIEPLITDTQWQGICQYGKVFDIDNFSERKSYFIEFEAAMNIIEVWVNGKFIKKDQGGYLPTVVDISGVAKPKGNIIMVRLDNRDNPITGPKPLRILDFNMYGGIYRNVWLYEKGETYITDPNFVDKIAGGGVFITTPTVAAEKSTVEIKTNIANNLERDREVKILHKIYNKKGKLVKTLSSTTTVRAKSDCDNNTVTTIADPLLWSPADPNLYTLTTEIFDGKELLDTQNSRFGIREFKFIDNKLYINGKKTYLRGTNRHQEYPYIGYALSDRAQYRDAYKIKSAGFDYVRLSHYPHSVAFMNACDELGIVVVDAILGWQYFNKDPRFSQQCYESAKRLIRRDRNHPSVLSWEVSLNETGMSTQFMERMHQIVHSEYPKALTYSCGWKSGVYDIYLQARQHRIVQKKSIDFSRPYMVSEYGDWEYYSSDEGFSQHTLPKNLRIEQSSRQLRAAGEKGLRQQALNLQEAHNDNLSIAAYGDAYWVMFDYNRGTSNDIESSGVMDIFRLPKFSYDFFRSQREMSCKKDAVVSIASFWNDKSNSDVIVYSNCEEVELYLNGKLVEKRPADNDKNSKYLTHPPFTFKGVKFVSGELKAIGYNDGKKIKTSTVTTPDSVIALKCWVDISGKTPKAGENDQIFFYIAAVDKNGSIIPDYNGNISLELPENIKLLNFNGEIKAEAGIATALLKIGDKNGNFRVLAASEDGLAGKTVVKVE